MATHALGLFGAPEAAVTAAGKLRDAGFATPALMSPIPLESVEETLGPKKSVIRRFTFFGGLFGAAAGFLLAAGTAVVYLHPTGGRPIITLPPFLIITYEMTILCGILATVIGFFVSARLPAIRERVYVPDTAVDKFAVTVNCTDPEYFRRAADILRAAGAEEIREIRPES
jgi:hypothetical protein